MKWIKEFWDIGIYQIIKKLNTKKLICNQPGTWDVFIGHSRRSAEATTLAETLYQSFKEKDYSTWLDVKMNDTSLAAMEEGVCNAKLFVAIVTGPCVNNNKPNDNPDDNSYFKRWFCIEELRWAIKAGIRIQPVIRAKDREKRRISKVSTKRYSRIFRQKKNGLHLIVMILILESWNWETFSQLPARDILKNLKLVLDPLNFDLEINGAVERFHNGTREWAFQDFDHWVENKVDSRVCVLSADAGIGKTGIMSKLVHTRVKISLHIIFVDMMIVENVIQNMF